MSRWLVVVFLAVASATGWAQSTSLQDATTRAWNASLTAEQALKNASRTWNEINGKQRVALDAQTRLRNSPQSWRRDRELRAARSDAEALGRQLESASADVRRANDQLVAARRTLLAAIDAELRASPSAPRRAQLDQARVLIAPQSNKATRIVLPDLKIDPLADPEDLDLQAKAMRDAEIELVNQLKGLDAQTKELERVAVLRKQHDRSNELDRRDDNNARKGATPTSAGRGGTAAEDASNNPSPAPPSGPTGGDTTGRPDVSSFEMDATITLADIVDPQTIEELNRAQRSADPAKRAAAARLTRDAVKKKLEQLRDKRKQVEDRATTLRRGR